METIKQLITSEEVEVLVSEAVSIQGLNLTPKLLALGFYKVSTDKVEVELVNDHTNSSLERTWLNHFYQMASKALAHYYSPEETIKRLEAQYKMLEKQELQRREREEYSHSKATIIKNCDKAKSGKLNAYTSPYKNGRIELTFNIPSHEVKVRSNTNDFNVPDSFNYKEFLKELLGTTTVKEQQEIVVKWFAGGYYALVGTFKGRELRAREQQFSRGSL